MIATRSQLIATIGHEWIDESLLDRALTHSSFAAEHNTRHNERLEFLGDAVLELVITEWITEAFPEATEGQLTRIRQTLVRTETLAKVANRWLLGDSLMIGKGAATTDYVNKRPRTMAGVFEAVVGALFLDGGYHVARRTMRGVFKEHIEAIEDPTQHGKDPKSALQDESMRLTRELPVYRELSVSGPPHNLEFVIEVRVANLAVGVGRGTSKQRAQRAAASEALKTIIKKRARDV